MLSKFVAWWIEFKEKHLISDENWGNEFFDGLDREKAEKHMKGKVDDLCDL